MQEIRIRFSKTGKAKYISHLDLMRCFSRAMVRARIPVWYTQGFNPRPYLNFTMPLSLGVEGFNEAVDVRIDKEMDCAEIVSRLSAVMPPDIQIVSAAEPVHKMADIAASTYLYVIEQDTMPAEELAEALCKDAASPELLVCKRAKQGRERVMKTVNLAEHVSNFSAKADENGNVLARVTLPSSNQYGVNPKLFIGKLLGDVQVEPIRMRIIREAILCADNVIFE